MKKNLLVALVVVFGLALIGGGFFVFARNKKAEPAVEEPVDEGRYLETALVDRPYVSLTPRADGKELTLEIARIKNADSIDYELVYLAEGDLSRGVIGTIKYNGEDSVDRDLLLGSCSKNVCKYDEGVDGGTLTLKFRSSEGVRKFETDFVLQKGGDELVLAEGEFTLAGELAPTAYYVAMATVGLPEQVEGELVAGPYGVFTSGSTTVKAGQVVFAAPGDMAGYNALVWDGQAWEELETSSDRGGFETPSLGTFALADPSSETVTTTATP